MSLYEEGFTQNRELSWLTYNERVLEEALDESVPLFERLKYIAIFVSNLEEFIQVRVGGLINDDDDEIDEKSGMTADEQLDAVYERIRYLLEIKEIVHYKVEDELAKSGVIRIDKNGLSPEELTLVNDFYENNLKSGIRTKLIRKAGEFPHISQDRTYIIVRLDGGESNPYALINVAADIDKILVLDYGTPLGAPMRYIKVEDIIRMHVDELLEPFHVEEYHSIDIARNAEISMDSDDGDMLLRMKKMSVQRKFAPPDKLIVDSEMSNSMAEFMMDAFNLKNNQVFLSGVIDYSYVGELEDNLPAWLSEKLCYERITAFNQLRLGHGNMIDRLKKREFLCCYPYDSMDPLIELLKECTTDERVKEIRITIYRLSSHPKIIEYLEQAAKNGKKVTAVMELRARFDEMNNIEWSKILRKHGVYVCYGSEDLKIHSKLAQIVMEENGKERFITHLSTGNFNEKTATQYTDIALITYDQRIGIAADKLWHDILNNEIGSYEHILTSPRNMKETLIELIRREAEKGPDGRIFIKVNSLTDEDLIEELMKASCSGCIIKMIVRGICCMLPEIADATENIEIVNVVGRFLEHSRVYIFGTNQDEVMYISSADFMNRNMSKRIELACPVYNIEFRNRIKRILSLNYMDNVKGRRLGSDGKYHHKTSTGTMIDSQDILIKESCI